MAILLALPVRGEAIHDRVDPGLWIPVDVQLDERKDEGVVDDLAGVFFRQAVAPGNSSDEAHEECPVELVEGGSVQIPGSRAYSRPADD